MNLKTTEEVHELASSIYWLVEHGQIDEARAKLQEAIARGREQGMREAAEILEKRLKYLVGVKERAGGFYSERHIELAINEAHESQQAILAAIEKKEKV